MSNSDFKEIPGRDRGLLEGIRYSHRNFHGWPESVPKIWHRDQDQAEIFIIEKHDLHPHQRVGPDHAVEYFTAQYQHDSKSNGKIRELGSSWADIVNRFDYKAAFQKQVKATQAYINILNSQNNSQIRVARAAVPPLRQRTQYTCMACSLSSCLQALGLDVDEDTVNEVMGAAPMRGASWEQAFAAAQYFGMRVHFMTPTPLGQLKSWTDQGLPVMIAWNPEGREWSHASVVFDVDDGENVHIMDPNIPDPNTSVRILSSEAFYSKWFEKWSNYLVRRPAMAIEREITKSGTQVRL